MDVNNRHCCNSNPQLRRSQMTEEQRNFLRERDRLNYKQRRSRLSEEELNSVRAQIRQRAQIRRQNLAQEDRLRLLKHSRLLYQNHRRQNLSTTELNNSTPAGPSSNTESNIDTTMTARLEQQLQSELNRFGLSKSIASLSTHMDSINVDLNGVSQSNEDCSSSQPMNIYDVNICSNWNSFQSSTDIFQAGEEHLQSSLPETSLSRSTRRVCHQQSYFNCARNVVGSRAIQVLDLSSIKTCANCQAKLFPYETQNICCCHGRVQLPLPPIPPELLRLFKDQSVYGVHFRNNIRAYNHVHSFTSMGVHLDHNLANAQDGVYTYKAQGSIYHRIGGLLPQQDQRPRYLQMYVFDTDHELQNRISENSLVDRTVLAILKQVLDTCNPYVKVFRQIAQSHDRDTIRLHIKEGTPNNRRYDLPTASQIAAVLVGGEDPSEMNERDIIVENRSGILFNLPDTAGFYDPLQYPLFHPYGSFGWDLSFHHHFPTKVSTREFYSYMFQIRDNYDSILLRGGRLLQQFAVDQYVKIATQNLRWIRDHQKTIRAEAYQALEDSFRVGGNSSETTIQRDEIRQFVDARWICPHEAFWRIFAFPLNRMYPAVYSLPVHLQHMHNVSFEEQTPLADLLNNDKNSRTMLTEFFEMNKTDERAMQLLYYEFPEHYVWNDKENRWYPRKKPYKVIGRLNCVLPSEGERYYLRVMLLHRKGPTSFDDLKIVQSVRYSTFREATQQMGLFQKDTLIIDTMHEATQTQMPAALRKLFVTILIYCNPLEVRCLWDEFHKYMLEDYSTSSSSHSSIRHLINDLELSLNDFGKGIKDFDLPVTADFPNEDSEFNPIIHDERSIPISEQDLKAITSLNSNQKHAFDIIMDAIRKEKGSVFFIDGPAGTGKTFLYRALLAAIRTDGHIALATASSGIASIMMPGGRTAHSRFKIPIPILPTSTCKISKQSDLADLLREAAVIIWDEASMAHRNIFEALDRTLQDLLSCDSPFGGKIVVLGGDFRQVLPIVPNGGRYQTVNACVTYSPLWDHVQVLHLSQNMRASTDPLYAEMLLQIGNGSHPYINDNMIRLADEMIIPWEGDHSITQLIHAIFPNIRENAFNKDYIIQRALITPKNIHVHELNDQVLKLFPGNEITYHSFDDAQDDNKQLYEVEFLNSVSTSQLPPHKLCLKIGCPLIVLRNLDPKNGVCNGTRVLLRAVTENIMHAEIISGNFAGEPVLIPRIPLRSSQQDIKLPFVLIRNQFPVRLSFALTINKSQGQTIPHIGIYLPDHVFSHGQLYVALSRSTSRDNTKILIKNASVDDCPGYYTKNVVFDEVLHRQG